MCDAREARHTKTNLLHEGWAYLRPEPIMLFILPLYYSAILKNLPYYSPKRTNYSLSKTYYSH